MFIKQFLNTKVIHNLSAMKIKYLVYAILIIGLGGFIAYRITENKSETNISPIAVGSFKKRKFMYANPADKTIRMDIR